MYKYIMMPAALKDLQEIGDYISDTLYAPESASALLSDIRDAIQRACLFPLSLPKAQHELLNPLGIRKIIVRNYIVLVIPDEAARELNVIRVLFHAQDYVKQLLR